MDFDISVEVSRLYVSFFNRAADPEGLQYWVKRYNDEVAAGRDGKMFLEDMADSFAQSPEAKAIYETTASPTDAEIKAYISEAYMNMFGRTPDDEGLDYWAGRWKTEMDQGKPGVRVLFEIENAARNSTNQNDVDALKNKAEVAAKFTSDFVASGADWKSEDMASAKSIVDKVDHTPASVQSANDEIAKFIEEKTNPDGGQEPGGGDPDGGNGGGPVVPDPLPAASIANGVISIAAGTEVTLSENNGVLTLSRPGYYSVAFNDASVTEINVAAGGKVNVASTGSFAKFGGDGVVNVTGVVIAEATLGQSINYATYIETIYNLGHNNQGGQTGIDVSVNGSEGDTIKALWDIWDDVYTSTENAYYNKNINTATLELALRYVEYLKDGGIPFSDFSAKVEAGRDQSLHDNLLGNFHVGTIQDRWPTDEAAELIQRIKDEAGEGYVARGVFSGRSTDVGSDAHKVVLAFDYAMGWNRSDYSGPVNEFGKLDASAIYNNKEMWNGNGIDALSNFTISTNEEAGIELALRARGRDNANSVTYDSTDKQYDAAGGIFGDKAKWNFDLSITSGLNGSPLSMKDFDIFLKVDIDPTEKNDFITLKLTDGPTIDGAFESFLLTGSQTVGFSDNVGGHHATELGSNNRPLDIAGDKIAQNSQNFHFGWIKHLIDANHPNWDFQDGQFEIELLAERNGDLVASTEITVIVGQGGAFAFDIGPQ
ncbi:hypothetical protein DEVEQU_01131 [Devosia equisanguinis]|uniref:DUF4214 domain-containing protein n=1 Tax=Devosia equisanguinis TaxID=2490941 RepID=A0A3S5D3A2_9HYPH|nr:DUF4214 domain-containing protein [Devosia equisanguinis]VDS04002.1 hypothetical protein DEVEQU_01131 [Devosia equisanguinis]